MTTRQLTWLALVAGAALLAKPRVWAEDYTVKFDCYKSGPPGPECKNASTGTTIRPEHLDPDELQGWTSVGDEIGSRLLNATGATVVSFHMARDPRKSPSARFVADATSAGKLFKHGEVWLKKDRTEVVFNGGNIPDNTYLWSLVVPRVPTYPRNYLLGEARTSNFPVPQDGTWERVYPAKALKPPTPVMRNLIAASPTELRDFTVSAASSDGQTVLFLAADVLYVYEERAQAVHRMLEPLELPVGIDRITTERKGSSEAFVLWKEGREVGRLDASKLRKERLIGRVPGLAQEPGPSQFRIAQQTAYQVAPIKIRVAGKEDFKAHRIEVVAQVPKDYARPFQKGDPVPKEEKGGVQANGKITFYGTCADAEGLWHWDDCARYEDSFSMDIRVGRRYEYDPSGLMRPGYVIRAVKNGNLAELDADGKVFFFNGPPTNTQGPHHEDCPYRLVINTKQQNEVVQAVSMEPIAKPRPARPRAEPPTKLSTVVQAAIDSFKPMPVGPTLADHIADEIIKWLTSRPDR